MKEILNNIFVVNVMMIVQKYNIYCLKKEVYKMNRSLELRKEIQDLEMNGSRERFSCMEWHYICQYLRGELRGREEMKKEVREWISVRAPLIAPLIVLEDFDATFEGEK